jgi:threonylcarbamoyladenosine tRNA methylthiotransferase MtaB
MPGVPEPVRRDRAARLRAAATPHAAAFHAALLGRVVQVVAERGGGGHTEHFALVRLATTHPPGTLLPARVTAADATGLQAAG